MSGKQLCCWPPELPGGCDFGGYSGFPGGSVVKNLPASVGNSGSILGLG